MRPYPHPLPDPSSHSCFPTFQGILVEQKHCHPTNGIGDSRLLVFSLVTSFCAKPWQLGCTVTDLPPGGPRTVGDPLLNYLDLL